MPIDWQAAQVLLTAQGYACGTPDGVAGPKTFTALYAFAASRQADDMIRLRGKVAAEHFAAYGMTTAPRIAEFIAQCCNETGGFRRFVENMSYSAQALVALWPSHFTKAQALAAVGNPVEIASRAYGGRMGNDPWPSHDGYTYRGRYDLQLTGKVNYKHYGDLIGIDLVTNPDAAPPEAGPLIALEFFRQGKVNAAVDRGDFVEARRITNGGRIGLENVAKIRNRLRGILLG
ncbi:putative chitinase [Sphingomonas sp. YR710]|uniref:glycoside hydrolase family 19 protein n=1 Tax=Sphingomonas sp. YR710 TaxID=1882773 RepID=UPI00088647A6|nr:glycoside hydrolase family 19 protein [Sphingomonas sp. YR710]SDC31328.1 putative chitinase [Sphingomonas sp. YR710]